MSESENESAVCCAGRGQWDCDHGPDRDVRDEESESENESGNESESGAGHGHDHRHGRDLVSAQNQTFCRRASETVFARPWDLMQPLPLLMMMMMTILTLTIAMMMMMMMMMMVVVVLVIRCWVCCYGLMTMESGCGTGSLNQRCLLHRLGLSHP